MKADLLLAMIGGALLGLGLFGFLSALEREAAGIQGAG